MSAQTQITPAEERITIDDVKQRAAAVRDLAVLEAKETVRAATHEQLTKTIIVGVVAVAALASFAYYLGSRRPPKQPELFPGEEVWYVRRP
jgi:hypothetical protein